ncbi:stage II sporulation protein M [Paenibacillus sp. GCM10023252]|uniref:stage II sporulation protein M n=1 Tax=Paenibacillus sp. GCM10023252 TaxID=3252649 RepID=UPI003617BC86
MRSSLSPVTMKDQLTLYVFVAVLFVVGVVFGVLMVEALTLEQQQNLSQDVRQYVQLLQAGSLPDEAQSFWDRFLFHSKWMLLLWLLGITVVGVPFVLALDFLKGALVGFAIGTLISQHAWKGVLFSLVSIAPPNLIAIPALMMTSVAALTFSMYVIKNRLLQRKGTLGPQVLTYTSTALLMLLLLAGAALVEAYLSPIMMSWVTPLLDAPDPLGQGGKV